MNETIAKRNYEYCNETLRLRHKTESLFLSHGERLFRIQTDKMYEPNYESFNEFLQDFKIDQSVASRLVNIFKKFVVEYGFSFEELGKTNWTKLAEILTVVKTKKEAEIWLSKLEHLKRKDIRDEITEKRTGIKMEKCKHLDYYDVRICKVCGIKVRKYEQ